MREVFMSWLYSSPWKMRPVAGCTGFVAGEPAPISHSALDNHDIAESFCSLLAFAGHVVVPTHKGALRIVSPCPDMQLKERSGDAEFEPEAIRSLGNAYRQRVEAQGDAVGRCVQHAATRGS